MPRKAAPKRKEPETTKDEEPKVEEETKKEETAKKPRRGKNAKNDVKEEKKEEPKKEEPKEEAKPKAQRGKRGAAAKKEEPKEEEKDDSEEKEEKEEPKPKRGKKAAPKKEEKKEEKTEEKPKEEEKKAPKGGRRGAKAANKKEEPKEEEKKEEEKKEEEKTEEKEEEEKPKKGGKRGAKATKKEEKEEAEPASKKPKRAAASKKKAADDEEEGEGEEGAEGTSASSGANSGDTDFSTPKKKDGELKIISWNIAGWKAILGKGFNEYVKNEDPDVICIQETKVAGATVKEDFLPGYYAHFNGCTKQPGYAGTGMFSKVKPIAWTDGIGIADHDEEGRVITAEFDKFYLVNTYIPNSGRGLKDLEYRKKWDKDFLDYLKLLDAKKPVIWTGDLNVAHEEIDLKNPKTNKNKTAGFSDAEREGFTAVLKSGFVDAFRKLYPKEEGAYTFWTYMGNARGKDIGWRLDYFVVSQRAIDKMSDTYRRPKILGSDHCPIGIHIALK